MDKKNVDLLPFGYYLKQINTYDLFTVFSDFLTLNICCFSNVRKDDEYFKIIRKYSNDEIHLFSHAFSAVIYEADNNGMGFKDPFGDFFQEHFRDEYKGQFFTPECVSDLITKIIYRGDGRDVYDPCCGSGRLFLAHAQNCNREEHYYIGYDISYLCCQMALINLCLNSMRGEIIWGNSLTFETWCRWLVVVDDVLKIPFIYQVEKDKNNTPEDVQNVEFMEIKQTEMKPLKPAISQDIGYVIFS